MLIKHFKINKRKRCNRRFQTPDAHECSSINCPYAAVKCINNPVENANTITKRLKTVAKKTRLTDIIRVMTDNCTQYRPTIDGFGAQTTIQGPDLVHRTLDT